MLDMLQGELFDGSAPLAQFPSFEDLEMPDAELRLCRSFMPQKAAERAYEELRADVDWQVETYVMYGREIPSPRLTAWFGDIDSVYTYSGVRHEPNPWASMPLISALRASVEAAVGARFNSVLLNYYRNGRDSVAWHSDDEAELGAQPVIASLSLGVPRVFQLKHRERTELERVDIELPGGSLLVMAGDCQRYWCHQIPKRQKLRAGRINLTFRMCLGDQG